MEGNDKTEYRNWYKALQRIQKKELILFVVLILLAFIFVGISSDICKWLKTEVIYDIVNNKCLKTEVIHDIVNNKLLINIPICIINYTRNRELEGAIPFNESIDRYTNERWSDNEVERRMHR